jgi:hypothetical protein
MSSSGDRALAAKAERVLSASLRRRPSVRRRRSRNGIRSAKVKRVRAAIAEGSYDEEELLDMALVSLAADLEEMLDEHGCCDFEE